jgi:hypothetical protein
MAAGTYQTFKMAVNLACFSMPQLFDPGSSDKLPAQNTGGLYKTCEHWTVL